MVVEGCGSASVQGGVQYAEVRAKETITGGTVVVEGCGSVQGDVCFADVRPAEAREGCFLACREGQLFLFWRRCKVHLLVWCNSL